MRNIKDEAILHVLLMPGAGEFTKEQYDQVKQISHDFTEVMAGIYLEMSRKGELKGLPGPLKVATLISSCLSLLITNLQAMPEHSRKVVADAMIEAIEEGEQRIAEGRRQKETENEHPH